MKALIDGDVLIHECSAIGTNKEGEVLDFEFVSTIFDNRIAEILKATEADGQPTLFITGDAKLLKEDYRPNFRFTAAVSKPYKGTRKQPKPYHYWNLRAYALSRYLCNIANGCEADDELCIAQYGRLDTILCSRDKDLHQCPGWHYGWEVGKQAEFGPECYTRIGLLRKSSSRIKGGGFIFFLSQLLVGDVVDNIGGLYGWGPVKTYDLLSPIKSERDGLCAVRDAYREVYGDDWKTKLREQSDLLWIIKERNEDGSLKMFNPKDYL